LSFLSFSVAVLTLVTSFTLCGGIGQAHEGGGAVDRTSVQSEDSDSLTALTRGLADAQIDVTERVRMAVSRRQRLAELIEQNPGEVLRQAISPAARAALAPEVQSLVESSESHDGVIEVFHADGPQGGVYQYDLRKNSGERLSLHFATGDGPQVLTGTPVRVRGVRVDQALALGSSSSVTVVGQPPLPRTFGEHRVLVVLVKFTDTLATAEPSPATVQTVFFGSGMSATNFFLETSYQRTWLSGTVVGPVSVAMTSAGCDYNKIAMLAQQAAVTLGVSPGQYNHLVYAFPNSGCSWWGLGSVGGLPGEVWINGSIVPRVATHELGHNLGLYHSHLLECGTVTLGSSCSSIDYGDLYDVMGSGSGPNHYNAVQKDLLGWLDNTGMPPITTVQATGTYTIDPLETAGTNPKALRILTAQGDWLYVELRRPIGFDSNIASISNVMNGVLVHYWDGTPNGVYVLDMTPTTSSSADPALTVGTTFQDVAGGVTITPLWVNGTNAGVNVSVGGACRRAAPTVSLTPAQQQAVAGTTVTYGLSVQNNDTGCGTATFAPQVSVPAGWAVTIGTPSFGLPGGATALTAVHVTSSAAAAAGSFTVRITASDGTLSSATTATYVVTPTPPPPVGGNAGAFADDFGRADAATLGNGWSVVSGSLKVVAGEARNDVAKALHMAVRPGLSGAVQTVTASFASMSNNVGPRLGLVLRYQDASNYYTCYRMTGGSSVLRIAKVVGGVETVLKSVTIANPAANALFTLSCQASGNMLTLQLNGVTKVSAGDAAFASGSVGFAMGGGNGGTVSHRADNFSATVQ